MVVLSAIPGLDVVWVSVVWVWSGDEKNVCRHVRSCALAGAQVFQRADVLLAELVGDAV
jgi:hypothetical protein